MACQKSSSLLTLLLILANLPGEYHQLHFERNRTSTTYKWIGYITQAFIYICLLSKGWFSSTRFQLLVTLSMFWSDALGFFRAKTRHLCPKECHCIWLRHRQDYLQSKAGTRRTTPFSFLNQLRSPHFINTLYCPYSYCVYEWYIITMKAATARCPQCRIME